MLLASHTGHALEAGLDEAGRGCLAGPVFAAAVILPPDFDPRFLNDSKQLSAKRRDALRPIICAEAIAWAVGQASVEEITSINIAQASYLAMHRAVAALAVTPGHLLVDGNRFKPMAGFPHTCIIGGDGLYRSIAAASILAKTFRDEHMAALAEEFPEYGWQQNAAYPTASHRAAIRAHGPSPHHRMGFRLL
ncbi:ribonuclease HII [Hymenobacter artigasi]|jgi:ribonuclease HII|uniref:Ribonuclease HII n=1 Tax=Hymenobacter artigasi TaxID=2719616 RepID=A0ABX1HGM5_9BACT|nr:MULTISPECIES: ribonuclease HII [Hymenobacter]MBU6120929.1 ribonuclease HII [Hymenobacter siberiensis]NKI88146.1 ribonuclease HII [Hymenobacter artigasi]